MNKRLVSVIIPTYSRPDNIIRAIESVLAQTYKNIEIIVVDDNGVGTPHQIETENVLADYIAQNRITYLRHDVNKNGSAARNTGFRASHGEYVNFLDDDDIFMPEKIEKQVEQLEGTDDKIGATYCNTEIIRRQFITGRVIKEQTKNVLDGQILVPYLLDECFFNTSAILFKRESIDDLSGFDESWNRHQDLEIMTRFFQKYSIISCQTVPLVSYDVSQERVNLPNCRKQYDLELKFLNHFKNLIPADSYNIVWKKFWFSCMSDSLIYCDYDTYKDAKTQLMYRSSLTTKDYFKLVKSFIIGKLR